MHKINPYRTLYMILACVWLGGCTVQQTRVEHGSIPASFAATEEEDAGGQAILSSLSEDYPLDNTSAQHHQLDNVFGQLAVAAALNPDDWQVLLLQAPDIVDVRAVQGNYIFVWSGIFDVIEDEDELAGLLACEMAHGLARHTDPVQFNMASELLFGISDVATSVGLIVLTQGAVSVSGIGMTRWAYVEATDLDPVDRVYSDEQVEDMAAIALLILERSSYSPQGLLHFWERAEADRATQKKVKRLVRNTPPEERLAILQDALAQLSSWQENDKKHSEFAEKTGTSARRASQALSM